MAPTTPMMDSTWLRGTRRHAPHLSQKARAFLPLSSFLFLPFPTYNFLPSLSLSLAPFHLLHIHTSISLFPSCLCSSLPIGDTTSLSQTKILNFSCQFPHPSVYFIFFFLFFSLSRRTHLFPIVFTRDPYLPNDFSIDPSFLSLDDKCPPRSCATCDAKEI